MSDRLTDHEIEILVEACPVHVRPLLTRLLTELRETRDAQAAREFMSDQEVAW